MRLCSKRYIVDSLLQLYNMAKIRFFFFAILMGFAATAFSQKQPLPKISTIFAQYKDTVKLNKEEVAAIIHSSIRVVDEKRVVYTIASYQVAYRRVAFYEDENTGKIHETTSLASERFTTTPLSPVWIKTIQEGVQKGEEIMFFDIIVRDPEGKVRFAPNFMIKVI